MSEVNPMSEAIDWLDDFRGRKRMQLDNLNHDASIHASYDKIGAERIRERATNGNLRFVKRGEGNLISSLIAPDMHLPALDLDLDHLYVPSSSPGHGHLYLTTPLSTARYHTLLSVLYSYGIVQRGILYQVEAHGMTTVRQPHVKKPQIEPSKEIF